MLPFLMLRIEGGHQLHQLHQLARIKEKKIVLPQIAQIITDYLYLICENSWSSWLPSLRGSCLTNQNTTKS